MVPCTMIKDVNPDNVLSFILALFLRETGVAARPVPRAQAAGGSH